MAERGTKQSPNVDQDPKLPPKNNIWCYLLSTGHVPPNGVLFTICRSLFTEEARGVVWGWRAEVEGGVATDTLCFSLQTVNKLNLAVKNILLIVPLKGGVRWRWGQACVHVVVSTLPAGLVRANLRQRWLAEIPLICSNNIDVSKHLLFFHRGQQWNNKVRLGLYWVMFHRLG